MFVLKSFIILAVGMYSSSVSAECSFRYIFVFLEIHRYSGPFEDIIGTVEVYSGPFEDKTGTVDIILSGPLLIERHV